MDGNICPGQIRPDIPRNDGRRDKPIKYETPTGSRLIVDVPPMVRPYIHDPKEELWITEGARKADSAVSHGLRCVSIAGVDGWRGKNEAGGAVALPCWERIALNGRKVVLAFDSDVTRKDSVQIALERLKAFLESKGAIVRVVYLPDGPSGEKTGLDDFFARGGTVQVLAEHTFDALRPTDKKRAKAETIALKQHAIAARGLPTIENQRRPIKRPSGRVCRRHRALQWRSAHALSQRPRLDRNWPQCTRRSGVTARCARAPASTCIQRRDVDFHHRTRRPARRGTAARLLHAIFGFARHLAKRA